ncbi:MAG: hypothetical protein VB085_12635 [Peptococcaceae bacterium]|nr:hypothetical protein [Peptococcaceae bacterium]
MELAKTDLFAGFWAVNREWQTLKGLKSEEDRLGGERENPPFKAKRGYRFLQQKEKTSRQHETNYRLKIK